MKIIKGGETKKFKIQRLIQRVAMIPKLAIII